jgi:tRNA(Leu) C34 or U34 (ribose-2'-O)-methylase TrmL
MWSQTIDAFGVDRWCMVPHCGTTFSSIDQHQTIQEALAAYPGKKTFLITPKSAPDAIPLQDYAHPENAIYVFGNTADGLVKYVTDDDDVVAIFTPVTCSMFGHTVLPTVLFSRMWG